MLFHLLIIKNDHFLTFEIVTDNPININYRNVLLFSINFSEIEQNLIYLIIETEK